MIVENLVQRGNEFREEMDSVLLTKRYLEKNSVKVAHAVKKQGHFQGIGAREIAKFLSKDGKVIGAHLL